MNIYQRINEIRKELKYLKKDASVTGYRAITHDYVTSEVRPLLVKHGVVVIPRQTSAEIRETGKVTNKGVPYTAYIGEYEFDFVNIDEPDDRFTASVGAISEDTADKGPGGAISYAMKYVLLKVFNIETGESEESRYDQKPDYINTDQATEISDLIVETSTDLKKFLEYVGADTVEKIPQGKYQVALSALNAKKDKMRQPGSEG